MNSIVEITVTKDYIHPTRYEKGEIGMLIGLEGQSAFVLIGERIAKVDLVHLKVLSVKIP